MLFKESHYGAKAPQNMMYKEQNKIKNTILFQNYHPFKIFWKVAILQFLLNFFDFGPIFNFDAKIQVYKMNLWSG